MLRAAKTYIDNRTQKLDNATDPEVPVQCPRGERIASVSPRSSRTHRLHSCGFYSTTLLVRVMRVKKHNGSHWSPIPNLILWRPVHMFALLQVVAAL